MPAPAGLPSGTVSLLFSDIEGSTRLVQRLRDGYGEVLAQHHELLRAGFERHGGREIGTQGDAFFVVFSRAKDAVAAAIAGQRALAGHPWPEGVEVKVRMGIHTGEPTLGDEGYHGLGLHRAARICSAGHGRQILVSNATRELIEDELPPDVGLLDLGENRLKDLDRPERIFQILYPGAPSSFPPLKTLDAAGTPPGESGAKELAAAVAGEHPRRRPPARGVFAAAVVLAAAAVAVVLIVSGGGGPASARSIPANAVGVFRSDGSTLRASVPVGTSPSGIAAGAGAVWVTNTDDQTVSRIDPAEDRVAQTIDVGSGPLGIAVGGGSVWVANSLDGTVSRIDPEKNGGSVLQTIHVGNEPTGVAYGHGRVWVTNAADKTVSRIDPTSGRTAAPLPTGAGADAVAVGPEGVWVTSEATGTVTEIDPATGRPLQPISVGHGPAAVATGAGAVWVANALDGTVSKVDARRASVAATIPVGEQPRGVAVDGGTVWVTDEAGTLSQIRARDGAVTHSVKIGNRPGGVAVAPTGVYVAVRTSGLVHRGGTLRLVTTGDALDSVDPALAYTPLSLSLVGMTNDGLVAFRRVGGPSGSQLVPDLAEAIPTPSEDGRTYSFRLRSGVRYSTGRPVRPGDFRHAIERTFAIRGSPGPALYFGGIVGAGACRRAPRACDLSRGIVTDDGAGTVTFHLSAPDPDFLDKLALPAAFAVPSTAPRAAVAGGLPATGPYQIAALTKTHLELVRNRHFKTWSAAAHPAAYPDAIDLRLGVAPDAQLAAVARGTADWGFDVGAADPARVRTLPTRYATRVHANPTRSTELVFLDTGRPPFDDVRVRRALNAAVDRRALVRGTTARPTCQLLPPNFLGYRSYCPSGLSGDLGAARRLVAASGTRGRPVTVWTPDVPPTPARMGLVVAALRRLGYRARLHVVHGMGPYFAALDHGRPQAGYYPWGADYPAPSTFLPPLVSCGAPTNFSRFCDRALDADMRRATALQVTDPQAAGERWSSIDKRVTDLAPTVPFSNVAQVDFLSKRAGNYQYNPQWGVLLDQLWVR